jgi:hypothetical protein
MVLKLCLQVPLLLLTLELLYLALNVAQHRLHAHLHRQQEGHDRLKHCWIMSMKQQTQSVSMHRAGLGAC